MEIRLLNRHHSGSKPFPKILLYSVVFHYLVFFFLLGNPFLILTHRGGGSAAHVDLNVQLLSPAQVESAQNTQKKFDIRNFRAFRPEEEEGISEVPEKDSLPMDGTQVVDSAGSPTSSSAKKAGRKPPPNMTGPEDCMLKVVGMVCPSADPQCIADYVAFCSTLPE